MQQAARQPWKEVRTRPSTNNDMGTLTAPTRKSAIASDNTKQEVGSRRGMFTHTAQMTRALPRQHDTAIGTSNTEYSTSDGSAIFRRAASSGQIQIAASGLGCPVECLEEMRRAHDHLGVFSFLSYPLCFVSVAVSSGEEHNHTYHHQFDFT